MRVCAVRAAGHNRAERDAGVCAGAQQLHRQLARQLALTDAGADGGLRCQHGALRHINGCTHGLQFAGVLAHAQRCQHRVRICGLRLQAGARQQVQLQKAHAPPFDAQACSAQCQRVQRSCGCLQRAGFICVGKKFAARALRFGLLQRRHHQQGGAAGWHKAQRGPFAKVKLQPGKVVHVGAGQYSQRCQVCLLQLFLDACNAAGV